MKYSAAKRDIKEEGMEKRVYITGTERKRCREVAAAFAELYRDEDIVVLDAGSYGYVKLQYYEPPFGFSVVTVFTDSRDLFTDLWHEWRNSRLLALAEGTPVAELGYKQIFQCLPRGKQREIARKRRYFERKAGLKKQQGKTGKGIRKKGIPDWMLCAVCSRNQGNKAGEKYRFICGNCGAYL